MKALSVGVTLQGGKYTIEQELGKGGFGITYLARQGLLNRQVAIKEFFYDAYCERDEATSHVTLGTLSSRELVTRYLKKFIKEAVIISRLNHPNIVQIHDVFEDNGTAYYVMEYIQGESLKDMVKRNGPISLQQALAYIKEVASALSYIHARNLNHLDIKPANIMHRSEDGRIMLIDFGVSKQYDSETNEGTTTTPVGISHGYSPSEQYHKNGVQQFSPQSDVYALAATLYTLLTGKRPPEAMEVQDLGLPLQPLKDNDVPELVITAIVNAMRTRSQRTQSVEQFVNELDNKFENKKTVPAPKQDWLDDDDEATVVRDDQVNDIIHTKIIKKKVEPIKIKRQEIADDVSKPKWSRKILPYLLIIAIPVILLVVGLNLYKSQVGDEQQQEEQVEVSEEQVAPQVQEAVATPQPLNGHWWVDLGLSVKWATTNVGASKPENYGSYYAWGETAYKTNYLWENCFDCLDGKGDSWSVYKIGGKTKLEPNSGHDTARENWGGTWRMPTDEEIKELVENCTWKWTKKGGHNGYEVTGSNGNSIFLPAAGFCDEEDKIGVGEYGKYWTSTLDSSKSFDACILYFYLDNVVYYSDANSRRYGLTVRPVTE